MDRMSYFYCNFAPNPANKYVYVVVVVAQILYQS